MTLKAETSQINIIEAKEKFFAEIAKFYHLDFLQKEALCTYVSDVLAENEKYNFIGKSTINDIWHRHILDCAQLMRFVENKNVKFADLGSGAGLPGMIISILGIKEIHLIEKSFRKADFLRKIKHLSKNRVFVYQSELENLENISFDCIASRALASLDKLLEHCQKFLKEDGYCLFLKGKKLPLEIKQAQEKFNFEYELYASLTSNESNIIKIKNISNKL
jgi:16S rRNA (guanine527-N7)-methyltransferase